MTLNPIPLRRRALSPDKHGPMDHGNKFLNIWVNNDSLSHHFNIEH